MGKAIVFVNTYESEGGGGASRTRRRRPHARRLRLPHYYYRYYYERLITELPVQGTCEATCKNYALESFPFSFSFSKLKAVMDDNTRTIICFFSCVRYIIIIRVERNYVTTRRGDLPTNAPSHQGVGILEEEQPFEAPPLELFGDSLPEQ